MAPEKEDGGGKDSENVKVVVRCRPMNEKETSTGCQLVVNVDEARGSITVTSPSDRSEPPKVFTFDTVFGPNCKQVDIYNIVARPIVESVLESYNGTIFAYGQTGTGKTFTMEGIRSVPELCGIIPNSFAHIFGAIAKSEGDVNFMVSVSYLEIYQEEVRNLLNLDQTAMEVKERPDIGVYVKDLKMCVVQNADSMNNVMTCGNKNRAVGATNMNATSSRSHAIFTVQIDCNDKGPDGKDRWRTGKLHLVDLAGSERQAKTGATGQRLKEATKINLSLSTLGNVISALVDGKSSHIPYRNSKLTRLLQDSLGGNSKTVMVANVGPADYNYDESISTLRYANRAKNIKNKARINEDPKDALLRQYQQEIEELKKKLEEGGNLSGLDEDGSEDEDGEGVDGEGRPKKKRKGRSKGLSKEKMAEIQAQIDADRRKLASQKDMEEEEKRKVEDNLSAKEAELAAAENEQKELARRLQAMEKKIIVGGENLLEKAEEQERLLEESAKELEQRKSAAEKLRKELEEKEAERLDIEEKYSSMQEAAAGKTKNLKKVWTMYMQTKAEIADLQQEHQREMEGLLENVRQLSQELRLQILLIDQFIPPEFQEMIEQYVNWNEDIGEWQLKCVAYTGNNMRKQTPSTDDNKTKSQESDLSQKYLAYTASGAAESQKSSKNKTSRPKTGVSSNKSKIAKRKKESSVDYGLN